MTHFDSLLKTQIYANPGRYSLKIESYVEVPAQLNLTEPDETCDKNTSYLIDPSQPANAIIRQPYILIHTNDPLINIKIYSKRIPYFMKAINRQYSYMFTGKTLSFMLDYLKTHPFETELSYHPTYGEQYEFFLD